MSDRSDSTATVHLPSGARISYRVLGDRTRGTPILLHRPLGGSMALWGTFAETLAAAKPVIAFDPLGVGASSDVPLTHTTREMAGDAVALLDALAIPQADVFGISLGGMVASWMAADTPLRVRKLVLASTLPRIGSVSPRLVSEAFGFARAFTKRGADAEVALVHRILSDRFRTTHPERVAAIERIVRQAPASRRNLVLLALAALRHDAARVLRGVGHDTLLIVGQCDPIVGKTAEHELLHDLAHARLEIVEGAGHDLSLEAPRELAARTLSFLDEGPLARTSFSPAVAQKTKRALDRESRERAPR